MDNPETLPQKMEDVAELVPHRIPSETAENAVPATETVPVEIPSSLSQDDKMKPAALESSIVRAPAPVPHYTSKLGVDVNMVEVEPSEAVESSPPKLVSGAIGQDVYMESCESKGNAKVVPVDQLSPQKSTDTIHPPIRRPSLVSNSVVSTTASESSEEVSESLRGSSLSLLAAQYNSNSDSDDDVYEVPATQNYQERFVEIDSDSSSTSSSDVEVLNEVRSPIDLDILGAGHAEEDDEENTRNARTPMVKGELNLDDLPPIQNLHITVPEEECAELGKVQSIIDQLVLVNSLPGTVPLDIDTVLFLDKGKQVLGEIFDVLGQVSDPLYCVRFNTNKEITEKGIVVGQTVYVAPRTQHTQFIVLANLMKMRGSDASWENDIEPPEKFLDYSDDEEERTARRSIRNRNRPSDVDDEAPKRHRPGEPAFNNSGVYPPPRLYRGNYYGPAGRQPHYAPPGSYNIANNSWHSNYYQSYVPSHQQHLQYRMPVHSPSGYRGPPRTMLHRPPPVHSGPPPTHSVPPPGHPGLVINPYAVFPPPPLMQQPLFPPPLQQPPPPPPPSHDGGF